LLILILYSLENFLMFLILFLNCNFSWIIVSNSVLFFLISDFFSMTFLKVLLFLISLFDQNLCYLFFNLTPHSIKVFFFLI
jgi:hypothetical protein